MVELVMLHMARPLVPASQPLPPPSPPLFRASRAASGGLRAAGTLAKLRNRVRSARKVAADGAGFVPPCDGGAGASGAERRSPSPLSVHTGRTASPSPPPAIAEHAAGSTPTRRRRPASAKSPSSARTRVNDSPRSVRSFHCGSPPSPRVRSLDTSSPPDTTTSQRSSSPVASVTPSGRHSPGRPHRRRHGRPVVPLSPKRSPEVRGVRV